MSDEPTSDHAAGESSDDEVTGADPEPVGETADETAGETVTMEVPTIEASTVGGPAPEVPSVEAPAEVPVAVPAGDVPEPPTRSRPAPRRLSSVARRRPEPGFAHVLGAGAGFFAVLAITALIAEIGGDPTVPGVLINLALAGAAFAIGVRVPGALRSMATAILVLTVPAIFFFAFFGGGSNDESLLRGALLLSAASYLVLYLIAWTKGRAVLLAFALLSS